MALMSIGDINLLADAMPEHPAPEPKPLKKINLHSRLKNVLVGKKIKGVRTYQQDKTHYLQLIFRGGDVLHISWEPDIDLDGILTFEFVRTIEESFNLYGPEAEVFETEP